MRQIQIFKQKSLRARNVALVKTDLKGVKDLQAAELQVKVEIQIYKL